MRVFIILPFYLIIILANLQRTTSEDCKCECCTSENCRPTTVGIHSLWFCSETTTCKQTSCIAWHSDQCPPQGTFGQTRAICVSTSNTERVLPIACFYKVFIPNNPRRSIQKIDHIVRNTTRIIVPYQRPTTMPQIRLDWLEKFGLIKRTSTSTTTHFFKQRF